MTRKSTIQTDLAFLLSELVQMPTVSSDNAANRQALQWVKWQLGGLPLHMTDFEQNGKASLVITTRPTKKPHLLMLAHMDVVPGPPLVFVPRVKNGRLYGRGTSDMKFAIACFLKMLLKIGADLPKYDLGVIITTDEEEGGMDGVQALAEQGYSADYAVVPDGAPDWGIETEAKGFQEVLIESRGVSGHASRPWSGDNAIDSLTAFLGELKPHFPAEPCGDPEHFHDTVNVGVIQAGEVSGIIPDYAKAIINVRLSSEANNAGFTKALASLVAKHPKIKTTVLLRNDHLKHQIDHPYTQLYADILRERGIEPTYVRSHGATDARYLSPVPALVAKPICGPQHADGEWIDLASVEQYYDVLRAFTERTARND